MKRYRNKSVSHRVLQSYYYRTRLTKSDLMKFNNQEDGFGGELGLDAFFDVLPADFLVVKDLMLPYGDTHFQIDALLAHGDTLYHYEVKNYSGFYTKTGNVFTSTSGWRVDDPYSQIARANMMLHNTMLRLGYDFKIVSFCVFINPEFHLASDSNMESILFAAQLPAHFQKLQEEPHSPNNEMKRFLSALIEMDDLTYRPPHLPAYQNVKAGILCAECHSFQQKCSRQTLICSKCGQKEAIAAGIARTAEEFHLLYPEKPIHTRQVFHWCGGEFPMHQVRRALKKHFVQQGHKKGATYCRKP